MVDIYNVCNNFLTTRCKCFSYYLLIPSCLAVIVSPGGFAEVCELPYFDDSTHFPQCF